MIEENVIDKLERWAEGKKTAPHKVHLYPTNRCNLRCPFCYQQLQPYDFSDVLSKEKWLSLTREICEMGTDVVRISGGGEPWLVPEKTIGMMRIVKEYDVTGRMTTNGTIIADEYIEEIVDMGWDHMVFSVDGPDAATHDFNRGVRGSFYKVIETIRNFNKIKREKGADKPVLEFGTALSRMNWRKCGEIVELASELDVDVITFEPLFVSNPQVEKLKLSEKDREEFVKRSCNWKQKAEDLDIFTNIDTVIDVGEVEETGSLKNKILERSENDSETENKFLNMPCFEPWLWPKIEADGTVGPCSTNLLDVNVKGKSFKEVWLGKEFDSFRELIKDKNLPSGCENCVSTHIPLNQEIRNKLEDRI